MTRLIAAAVVLGLAATPALACDWHKSAATDAKQSTVASQPATDHTTPPPIPAQSQKQG